ncbi:MAG TPA: hypothetical protein PK158_03025 [Spirochaetota bacterium]|nr:hypothetical protein [Spirochaetota bacterium]
MSVFLAVLFIIIILIPLWALLGGGSGEEKKVLSSEPKSPVFPDRRAGDRKSDIEKEIEDELKEKNQRRRRSDDEDSVEVQDDFTLPHKSGEIIPEGSPLEIYSKAISNIEHYIKRGDFESAISLYEGIQSRIGDEDIRNKIEENIDYLYNYQHISATRKEEKIKQKKKDEENQIKLSISGEEFKENIKISMAPAEIDIDKIAERVKSKISSNSSENDPEELNRLRNEISGLKNALSDLNEEKKEVKNKKSEELSDKLDEISDLKNTLTEISRFNAEYNASAITESIKQSMDSKHLSEIESLKKEIEQLKRQPAPESPQIKDTETITEEISSLQKEIEKLNDEKSHLQKIDDKVVNLLDKYHKDSENLEKRENELLKVEISNLKNELLNLAESIQSMKAPALSKTDSSLKEETADLINDSNTYQPSGNNFPPNQFSNQDSGPAALSSSSDDKEKEKDEFETLQDIVNGKKTDEPTDDEIMASILKSAADENSSKYKTPEKHEEPEEKENEYEIRGPKGEVQQDIDIDKLLYSPQPKTQEDEQFYSAFMERYAPKRKELPILRVTYAFDKLPDRNTLSREQNVLEYSFYKYKPMLEKAGDYIKRRRVKDALNYYKVILDQNIPNEFKTMVQKNVNDLNEYLEKYMNS